MYQPIRLIVNEGTKVIPPKTEITLQLAEPTAQMKTLAERKWISIKQKEV